MLPFLTLRRLLLLPYLPCGGLLAPSGPHAHYTLLTLRLLCSKSLGRPPSLAHLDKLNSNSLDSCVSLHELPPKVPPFSKLQDLADSVPPPRLTPSPAPVLHIDSPSCFSGQALSVGGSPLLYPKLSGFHRSLECLPLQMSVPSSPAPTCDREQERTSAVWSAGSRASLTLPERCVSAPHGPLF